MGNNLGKSIGYGGSAAVNQHSITRGGGKRAAVSPERGAGPTPTGASNTSRAEPITTTSRKIAKGCK